MSRHLKAIILAEIYYADNCSLQQWMRQLAMEDHPAIDDLYNNALMRIGWAT